MIEKLKEYWHTAVAVIGVLGTIFGIYAYYATKIDRNISYIVTSNIEIANRDKSKRSIIIKTPTEREISNNIYLIELSIWNSGNVYLSAQDIKSEIYIKIISGNVISASIQKEIMSEVARISLSNTNLACEHTQKNFAEYGNVVPISWCNLDPGFGAKIVLIYEADRPSTITVDGYISGISRILNFDGTGFVQKFGKSPTMYFIIFNLIVFTFSIRYTIIHRRVIVFLNDRQRYEFLRGVIDSQVKFLSTVIVIIVIVLAIWVYVHLSYSVEPPTNII